MDDEGKALRSALQSGSEARLSATRRIRQRPTSRFPFLGAGPIVGLGFRIRLFQISAPGPFLFGVAHSFPCGGRVDARGFHLSHSIAVAGHRDEGALSLAKSTG